MSDSSHLDTAAIDRIAGSMMQHTQTPGIAVVVVHENRSVYLRGYGIAGRGRRPVTPATPFLLGSVSKPICALAVMQLVEAGKLRLDDPVRRYLPWFRLADERNWRRITVRNLLTHTSGLPSDAYRPLDRTRLDERVRSLTEVTPRRPPSDKFEYSSPNYQILGAVVEEISNEPYGCYVQRHIFEPLEMCHSHVSFDEAKRDGMAEGHVPFFGFMRKSKLEDDPGGLPNGFIISTAEDLAHFAAAHLNGGMYRGRQVLSERGVAEMRTGGVDIPDADSRYALGWFVRNWHGEQVVWHGGSLPGYHSALLLMPRLELGVIVLTNASGVLMGHTARKLAFRIASVLLGDSAAPPTGLPLWSKYLCADAVVAALVTRELHAMRELRAASHRPPRQRVRFMASSLMTAAFGLIGVPKLAGAPLRAIALSMPDAVATITLISGLSLINAGVHASRLLAERRRREERSRRNSPERM